MFRRLPASLPPDPTALADMEKLGYFINEKDQIRMTSQPTQKYQFKIDRNDRVNDVYKESMNNCVRKIVRERLLNLGLDVLRLPIGTKQDESHVPILVSKNLKSKKRIIILFGERSQDLGIFSFRTIGEDGINIGSAVNMVNAILTHSTTGREEDAPGLILTNPGSLLWYRGEGRAVTDREWLHLPRASAVHEPFRIDPNKNRIPGNHDHVQHVQYVFENVMTAQVDPNATFDIIGLEYTGTAVVHYLSENWTTWSERINGICLGNPQHLVTELTNVKFAGFFEKRGRAYYVSDNTVESVLPGRDRVGCNCYASGEELYEEGIMIKSWGSMLDWFNMINALRDYEEPVFTMIEDEGSGPTE